MRALIPGAQLSWHCRCIAIFFKIFWIAIVLVLVLVLYANKVQYESMQETNTQMEIVMLQSKLRFLQFQNKMKQGLVKKLKNEIMVKLNTDDSEESDKSDSVYDDIVRLLKEKSDAENFTFVKPVQHPKPIQASISFTTMPHLLRSNRTTCPAVQISSPRKSGDIDVVIGIPTVKRDVENYLADTIRSLIDGMTPEELKKTLIIISIGEVDDLNYIADTVYSLNFEFEAYFGELIEVISPTKYWYPDWNALQPTLGDSQKRSRWRTKQNLDAVFLISYAQSRGAHYLMLEDDVVAKKGYMTEILKFATNQTLTNPHWFFINFSRTGGIGKFFRMEDLSFFSAYLQVLYQYMPIDWLIELYLAGRVCGLQKSSEKCGQLKNSIRPTYKRTLFEHAGLYSSLRGKIQKVKRRKHKWLKRIKLKNTYADKLFTIKVYVMQNNHESVMKTLASGLRDRGILEDWKMAGINNSIHLIRRL